MILLLLISIQLSSSVSPSETVMDMYAAKLRIYRPYRVFVNSEQITVAARDAILQYNGKVSDGSLSRGDNTYMLNVFGVLCAISTTSWEYSEANKCSKPIKLESPEYLKAQGILVTLFGLAHGVDR